MKTMLTNYFITHQTRIVTALILTGILSVSSGLTLAKRATAAPSDFAPATTKEVSAKKQNRLPSSVANAVLQDITKRTGIPARKLQIIAYTKKTWNDGCLGLARPDEFCTQALVPGWRVVVSSGKQKWVYHTNEDGRSFRIASGNTSSQNELPRKVRNAVLQKAREISGLPMRSLTILDFKTTDWAYGCEQPTFPNPCDPIVISGWQVTIGGANQRWIFLSDNDGSLLRLAQGNNTGNAQTAVFIPTSELPPPLDAGVIFRQISSGGLAAITYETVLLSDGRLIRVRVGDANDSERSVRRVSSQQLQQFQELLRSANWEFRNLSYPAPNGAADFITYTITSRTGTVQYNDISQNNLPRSLQQLVTVWNQILANSQ